MIAYQARRSARDSRSVRIGSSGAYLLVSFGSASLLSADFYCSGLLTAQILMGSQLLVRWSADPSISRGRVFGVDNVSLSLVGNGGVAIGDSDRNGILDAADINALMSQSASHANDIAFDLNNDALVDEADVAGDGKVLADIFPCSFRPPASHGVSTTLSRSSARPEDPFSC